jgi:hypothetical protein
MTSGPYQSKVLRFAIAQYRNGLERHRRAVGRARSGVVLGVAVTLLPVYAVLSASRSASQNISRSASQLLSKGRLGKRLLGRQLPGVTAQVAKFLKLSDFESSDFEASDFDNFEAVVATWQMAQTLLSVGACLNRSQISALIAPISDSALQVEAASDGASDSPLAVFSLLVGLSRRIKAALGVGRGVALQPSMQITGVASDLETRSLVLIRGYVTVWDGLTCEQQATLQAKIDGLLGGSGLFSGEAIQSAQSTLPMPMDLMVWASQSALGYSVRAFWVEVLRVMAWLHRDSLSNSRFLLTGAMAMAFPSLAQLDLPQAAQPGLKATQLSPAAETSLALPKAGIVLESSFFDYLVDCWRSIWTSVAGAGSVIEGRFPSVLPSLSPGQIGAAQLVESGGDSGVHAMVQGSGAEVTMQVEESGTSQYWEATVTAVAYLEHPLEKVLNWVDQLLLRLEVYWQRLMAFFQKIFQKWRNLSLGD